MNSLSAEHPARTALFAVVLAGLCFAAGCGQKGDLYLPREPAALAVSR